MFLKENIKKKETKKNSEDIFDPVNYRRNLNKTRARLRSLHKNSLTLLNHIKKNNEKEIQLYKQQLLKNEELKGDNTVVDLILYIKQLNNAIPKPYFDINDPENDTLYLTKKIFKILKTYKLFFFYFSHYKIDDKSIIKMIPLMFYEYYPKNSYIFKEGDVSSKFYFILKGKISFRKKINSLEFETAQEVEQYKMGEGRHFGEWSLVYNRKSKLSALCVENTHIIFFGKDTFQKYIQEKFTKIESDTNNNLINILNKYITIPQVKLERFVVSDVKMLFFKKNEIIFNEGDENRHLYIIYNGEANLIKNISKGEEHSIISSSNDISIDKIQKKAKKLNYKEIFKKPTLNRQNSLELELQLNKNNYSVISTLAKGSMAGLEIATGVTNFKYSLISNSNFTSVYKINLKSLDEHLKEFMLNILPLFIELEEKIHIQIDKIKYIDNSIIPYSCQKFKNNNKFNNFSNPIDIAENDKVFVNQIKKIEKKFDINEGGFIKMTKYNYNLHKQRNILKEQLKENHINDKKIDSFVKKYEESNRSNLKYKRVRMIQSSKSNSSINKNNSIISSKRRPISSTMNRVKIDSTIIKGGNENNSLHNTSKPGLKNTNNSQIMNSKKNYNLFFKEETNELQKETTKKKHEFISLFKLPKKKLTINQIKKSLSIDSKTLVKKVMIKSNSLFNMKKSSLLINKNTFNNINSNINYNTIKAYKNCDMNINDKNEINMKKKKFLREFGKKYNFYDTGEFDMPLFIQLGVK